MEIKELQQLAKEITSRPGKVRGEVYRTHAEYIKYKEGDGAIEKVEKKMKELGVPIKFDKMKPFEWTNEGSSALAIIVAKEIFNWTEDDIYEMGRFSPKVSFFLKVIIQYFVSMDRVLKEASKYWKKHFDFGSLEVVDFNEKEKRILMRVSGFDTHPLICRYHAGYFHGVTEFAVKSEDIKVEETSCLYRGDDYHEYLITWV